MTRIEVSLLDFLSRPLSRQPLFRNGELTINIQAGYKIRYLRTTKQITLVRNIVAALIYESRGISLEETLVLYDLVPQMLEKADKDEQFRIKHADGLITTYRLMKEQEFNPTSWPYKPKARLLEKFTEILKWIPSKSAYISWSRNPKREQSYSVVFRDLNLRPPKLKRELRWMGVGYRDKGKLRDPANDSSPHHKEVGQNVAYLERIKTEDPLSYQLQTKDKSPTFRKTINELVKERLGLNPEEVDRKS